MIHIFHCTKYLSAQYLSDNLYLPNIRPDQTCICRHLSELTQLHTSISFPEHQSQHISPSISVSAYQSQHISSSVSCIPNPIIPITTLTVQPLWTSRLI